MSGTDINALSASPNPSTSAHGNVSQDVTPPRVNDLASKSGFSSKSTNQTDKSEQIRNILAKLYSLVNNVTTVFSGFVPFIALAAYVVQPRRATSQQQSQVLPQSTFTEKPPIEDKAHVGLDPTVIAKIKQRCNNLLESVVKGKRPSDASLEKLLEDLGSIKARISDIDYQTHTKQIEGLIKAGKTVTEEQTPIPLQEKWRMEAVDDTLTFLALHVK